MGVEELAGVENSLAFMLCHLIKDICLSRVKGIDHLQLHIFVLNMVHRFKSASRYSLRAYVSLKRISHHEDREVVFSFQSLFAVVGGCLKCKSVGSIKYS